MNLDELHRGPCMQLLTTRDYIEYYWGLMLGAVIQGDKKAIQMLNTTAEIKTSLDLMRKRNEPSQ